MATGSDIDNWLQRNELGHLAQTFEEVNIDSFDQLRDITDNHLSEMGIKIGDRIRFKQAVGQTYASKMENNSQAEQTQGPASKKADGIFTKGRCSDTKPDKTLHIRNIPADWEFNDLLSNIAKLMTKEDLEDMKSRLKGDDGGLRRTVLETLETPHELFDVLQRHHFITRDNVLILQALLHRMDKIQLFNLAVNYAQATGNVVHFAKPPKEPPNGFRYVQIHVQGLRFTQYKRSCLEALRAHAARLMFVKPELVVIAGIMPSSSILITLMIPETFVKYLRQGIENSDCINEWTYFGVDYIRIDSIEYRLTGFESPEVEETEVQQQLKLIFQENDDIKEELANRDSEILKLKRCIEGNRTLNEKPLKKRKRTADTQKNRQEKRKASHV